MTNRTPHAIAEGVLPAGATIIVGPVPAGERWYLTRLDCFNPSTEDVDVTLLLRTNSTSREWKRARLDAEGGYCEAINSPAVLLNEGHAVLGFASVGGQVTFYAAGIKETDA